MKILKYFLITLLLICLNDSIFAGKRVQPAPMSELTDPNSPSYVLFPYPKNRKEIIADLNHAIKILNTGDDHFLNTDEIPLVDQIMVNLVSEHPKYKVGEIITVKSRNELCPHDYSYLILIVNEKNEIVARVLMDADGILGGSAALSPKALEQYKKKFPNSRRNPRFIETRENVLSFLSEDTGKPIDSKKIKKMERVAFPSSIGDKFVPMWEIECIDGKLFYYSDVTESIYEIEKKINWKKNEKGIRSDALKLIRDSKTPHNEGVIDTLNDEILILRKIKNK